MSRLATYEPSHWAIGSMSPCTGPSFCSLDRIALGWRWSTVARCSISSPRANAGVFIQHLHDGARALSGARHEPQHLGRPALV